MKKLMTNGLMYLLFFSVAFFLVFTLTPKPACNHSSSGPTLADVQAAEVRASEGCKECFVLLMESEEMIIKLLHTEEGPKSKELKARVLASLKMANEHIGCCPACQMLYGAVPDANPSDSVLDTLDSEFNPRRGM